MDRILEGEARSTWILVTSDFLLRRAFPNLGLAEGVDVTNLEGAVELRAQRPSEEEGTTMALATASEGGVIAASVISPLQRNQSTDRKDRRSKNGGVGGTSRRRLQVLGGDGGTLYLLFDVVIFFLTNDNESVDRDLDLSNYVSFAFDDPFDRSEYINALQDTEEPVFDNLVAVSVAMVVDDTRDDQDYVAENRGNKSPPEILGIDEQVDDSVDTMRWGLWAAVGVVLAGFVVSAVALGILVMMFFRRRKEGTILRPAEARGAHTRGLPLADFDANNLIGGPSIVDLDSCGGASVSSLGEPSFVSRTMFSADPYTDGNDDTDGRSDSFTGDYDYNKHYRSSAITADDVRDDRSKYSKGTGSTPSGSSFSGWRSLRGDSTVGRHYISDDSTFEAMFGTDTEGVMVDAPQGKLGVVLNTPEHGAPTIYIIKGDSPLFGMVQVGDRLISVDGIDVIELTSRQIAMLLSMKSQQSLRKLFFVRDQGGHLGRATNKPNKLMSH